MSDAGLIASTVFGCTGLLVAFVATMHRQRMAKYDEVIKAVEFNAEEGDLLVAEAHTLNEKTDLVLRLLDEWRDAYASTPLAREQPSPWKAHSAPVTHHRRSREIGSSDDDSYPCALCVSWQGEMGEEIPFLPDGSMATVMYSGIHETCAESVAQMWREKEDDV